MAELGISTHHKCHALPNSNTNSKTRQEPWERNDAWQWHTMNEMRCLRSFELKCGLYSCKHVHGPIQFPSIVLVFVFSMMWFLHAQWTHLHSYIFFVVSFCSPHIVLIQRAQHFIIRFYQSHHGKFHFCWHFVKIPIEFHFVSHHSLRQ